MSMSVNGKMKSKSSNLYFKRNLRPRVVNIKPLTLAEVLKHVSFPLTDKHIVMIDSFGSLNENLVLRHGRRHGLTYVRSMLKNTKRPTVGA